MRFTLRIKGPGMRMITKSELIGYPDLSKARVAADEHINRDPTVESVQILEGDKYVARRKRDPNGRLEEWKLLRG